MERITKIITVVSKLYDIDIVEFVTKNSGNKRRRIPFRTLNYLCYEGILNGETTINLKELSSLLRCPEALIISSHERTKMIMKNVQPDANCIAALQNLIAK